MSVVGIDLGTTNTVVACVRGGKVHVLADEAGSRLLPSVVSFHPNGEVLVGPPAKQRRVIDPKHTIANHKRIIGHSWNSPELVEARQRAPFELREGPGQGALVHVRGQDYTLPEISAFVLKRARQIAETALGEPVERAVITVPAHFNELQRASTKVAGRISGVEVMRILNEPTAAALAYGLGRGGAERVAIYDFGGGTFDCTLLDLNGNVFEVLASAGDSFLGGDDADAAIAERMADYILKQYRFDARTDRQAFERLKVAGETVKMTLSTKEEAQIKLDDVGFGVGGAPLNVTFTMKRKEFEQLIQPLVERSFKVTQDALALARLSPSAFDRVILVGGSTRIPLVRARVEAFFGGKPMDKLNPDEVVAVGAAIQAAALVDAGRRREIPAPPPLPGTAPKTMRGTGPGGKDFDDSDSTESNTLARGEAPIAGTPGGAAPLTASGATTQRKGGTWPPGQRPIPGRGSQPPGRGSQPPGRTSQPPASARGPASQPPPGTRPMPTLQKPAAGNAPGSTPEDPSFPDLAVPSPFEWNANASTLTAQVDTEALAPKSRLDTTLTADVDPRAPQQPQSGRGGSRNFGAMDEPPSMQSTTGALAAFEGFGGDDEPLPDGPFGEVKDLSLVSSTGMTQTAIPQPTARGPALPREEPGKSFGHVADDLSLVSTTGERSSPSIPSIPSIQERTSPLPMGMSDPTGVPTSGAKPPRTSGAVVGGRTVQMQGVPPVAHTPQPFAPVTRQGANPPKIPAQTQLSPASPAASPAARSIQTAAPTTQQGVGRSTVALGQHAPGASQPPPPQQQSHSSAPPAAYPSNAPSMGGFSGFASGSQPPNASPSTAPGPVQMQSPQNPVFSGYGQQSAPPQFGGGTYPPGSGGSGSSPFGGTTEPPFQHSPLQEAAHQLGAQGGLQGMQAPVLVDVTPRALIVETAGGYVDTIIPRNSKIPCERMRKFSTSRDGQTVVRIRVGQGENSRFPENTYLGEVELAGLRQASRGDVTVAVSFELDADGTLRVRAWDTITLQEARATLQLIGMADESSVVMMINRFAQQPMGPTQ